MNVGLGSYLVMGLTMMNTMKSHQEEWKEEILKKWRESANYPRKKKKKVRKELQLDWSIACWSPFDI